MGLQGKTKNEAYMTTASAGIKLTSEDYYALPDDGQRYELIEGDLIVPPAPNLEHQGISGELYSLLKTEALSIGARIFAAPTDVYLSPDTVVQPDLLVVLREHAERMTQRGIEGAPDLIGEILSPGNSERDRQTKARLYAQAGVREYWIVSPEAKIIEVLVLRDGGYTVHLRAGYDEVVRSTVLKELSFPASRAFDW